MENKYKSLYDKNGLPIKKKLSFFDNLFSVNNNKNNSNYTNNLNYSRKQKEITENLESEKEEQENIKYNTDNISDEELDNILDLESEKIEKDNLRKSSDSIFSKEDINEMANQIESMDNIFLGNNIKEKPLYNSVNKEDKDKTPNKKSNTISDYLLGNTPKQKELALTEKQIFYFLIKVYILFSIIIILTNIF